MSRSGPQADVDVEFSVIGAAGLLSSKRASISLFLTLGDTDGLGLRVTLERKLREAGD